MSAPIRRVPVGKTLLLSIVTVGIYYLIQVYRTSHDLHQNQEGGTQSWQVLFWIGLFFAIPMYVLYVLNFLQAKRLRDRTGVPESGTGLAAVIFTFIPVIPALAQFLWASYFNALATHIGGPASGAPGIPARA